MKILLIGNLPEDRQESMQRFTALLQAGLQSRGHAVTVLCPRLRLARLGPRYRYSGLPKYLGYFDKFALFPRQVRRWIDAARPDLVHLTDQAGAVYGSAAAGVPVVATCHDLLQVRAARGELRRQSVGRAGRLQQEWIRASLARLDRVACVSVQTRADLLRLTGLPPQRVAVIPNALHYPYRPVPAVIARHRLAVLATRPGVGPPTFGPHPGGFLLHVGGGHWYKNRAGLLAIYAGLRRLLPLAPKLVVVGPPLSAADTALMRELGLEGHLVFLPDIANAELEALYSLAEGLLFPSWEEGFGWPVAEAQACGCPVFASNRAPMTEVGGSSSVYFDPALPAAAARIIATAWPGRGTRREPALAAARRWDPAPMLDAYEALYASLAHPSA